MPQKVTELATRQGSAIVAQDLMLVVDPTTSVIYKTPAVDFRGAGSFVSTNAPTSTPEDPLITSYIQGDVFYYEQGVAGIDFYTWDHENTVWVLSGNLLATQTTMDTLSANDIALDARIALLEASEHVFLNESVLDLVEEPYLTVDKTKVDAIEEVYTTVEQTKLASLSDHWKGEYPDLATLEASLEVFIAGDRAKLLDTGHYVNFDGTIWSLSGGDMSAGVYDPQSIIGDVFDRSIQTGEQTVATITGLQVELDAKALESDLTLAETDITTLQTTKQDISVYDPQAIGADSFDRVNHTGVQPIATVDGLQTDLDTRALESDLTLVETDVLALQTDKQDISVYDPQAIAGDSFDRVNHTGEQLIETVTDLQSTLDLTVNSVVVDSSIDVPIVDTLSRPVDAAKAMLSFNPDSKAFEGHNPETGEWGTIGGGGAVLPLSKSTDFTVEANKAYLIDMSDDVSKVVTIDTSVFQEGNWFSILMSGVNNTVGVLVSLTAVAGEWADVDASVDTLYIEANTNGTYMVQWLGGLLKVVQGSGETSLGSLPVADDSDIGSAVVVNGDNTGYEFLDVTNAFKPYEYGFGTNTLEADTYIDGYPANNEDSITQTYRREAHEVEVDAAFAASLHIATSNTWGRIRFKHDYAKAWIQGGFSGDGTGWSAELYHTGNEDALKTSLGLDLKASQSDLLAVEAKADTNTTDLVNAIRPYNYGFGTTSAADTYISGYTLSLEDNINQVYRRETNDNGVLSYSPSLHVATGDTWGRIRFCYHTSKAWIQGGITTGAYGWTEELYHTGNVVAAKTAYGLNSTEVAIGSYSGLSLQGDSAVAIGDFAGNSDQGDKAVAVGRHSGKISQGIASVAVGEIAGNNTQGEAAVAVGTYAGQTTQGTKAVAVGSYAGKTLQGARSTAVGSYAAESGQGIYATALGSYAGRYNQADYSTCLGYDSQVTGTYQVQLGSTSATVYSQNAIVNRSDIRDKTEVEDGLGYEFIMAVKPIQFKWDIRSDYNTYEETTDEDGNVTLVTKVEHERDGSKSGTRKHQGVSAQQIKEVMDDQGVDFAGYKDSSFDGGEDVLSIGYTEFIAPMISAMQTMDSTIKEMQSIIESQGVLIASLQEQL